MHNPFVILLFAYLDYCRADSMTPLEFILNLSSLPESERDEFIGKQTASWTTSWRYCRLDVPDCFDQFVIPPSPNS